MSKYDTLDEVRKHDSEARTLEEVLKFNPYHDALGRFASANGATSFTFRTNSPAGQKAIANIKAKQHAASGGSSSSGEHRERRGNQERQTEHPDGEYGRNGVTEEGIAEIAKNTGANRERAEEYAEAISSFTGPESTEIRQYQTYGPPPDMEKESEALEAFIEQSPKWEGEVHRGIGTDRETAEEIVRQARAGEEMGMLGASSWSTNAETAGDFAEGNSEGAVVLFRSTGPQNGTSVRYVSEYPMEDEVLMSNDARWKPTNVETDEDDFGTLYVYVDLESLY